MYFYLFALGCSIGVKFISSEVRFVESTCSVERKRHALCMDTHMVSTYCDTCPLIAPNL